MNFVADFDGFSARRRWCRRHIVFHVVRTGAPDVRNRDGVDRVIPSADAFGDIENRIWFSFVKQSRILESGF